ncbi:hypothetical protein [Pseudonocardia acidicola]|uniref:Uncharacterized protein n=1 Tax=Pseudonocardia acidicola TaxID=2724939 RepID=A0ABX1SIF4_9PSEU|nr:hypothetical protein [Pseudonocardia acidicola]NMI00725.1 hypothetical protein [Pseudonocardia acidicola]
MPAVLEDNTAAPLGEVADALCLSRAEARRLTGLGDRDPIGPDALIVASLRRPAAAQHAGGPRAPRRAS